LNTGKDMATMTMAIVEEVMTMTMITITETTK
jgi:hypothetical protein